MPSSRIVSREQAFRNENERIIKVAEAQRKTARYRKAAIAQSVDFFVGGPARGIARGAKAVAEIAKKSTVQNVQFGSNKAKGVIRDVQGLAKMVIKGFGN